MYLRKHYDPKSLETGNPRVTHVEVLRSGPRWNPSTQIIENGQNDGWLKRDGDVLTILTDLCDPDLQYRIVVPPGLYCCHCGEKCDGGRSAIVHIKSAHGAVKSPSATNPAGYARHNFYMTELIEE